MESSLTSSALFLNYSTATAVNIEYIKRVNGLSSIVEMRMSYRQFVKLAKNSAGKDASKATGKVPNKEGFLKELFLSPQFPRLLLLAIGGASAAGFYFKNGMKNDSQKKKDELLGDIKIENYNERLAKYATSMEVALHPNGKEHLKGVREVMEVYNQLGLNFQDVSREQLVAFQAAEITRQKKMKSYALERNLLYFSTRGKFHKALAEKGKASDATVIPSAVNQLSPEEEKVITRIAINEEKADMEFWSSILAASTPDQRKQLSLLAAQAATNNRAGRTLLPHSFANMSSYLSPYQRPHVFVLKFDGKRSQHA